MSTGLCGEAFGLSARIFARASAGSAGMSSPASAAKSAICTPMPPELDMTATRRSGGQVGHGRHVAAALRDHTGVAAGRQAAHATIGKAQIGAASQVEGPGAVRAEHAHSARARDGSDLVLCRAAALVQLGETGAED